MQANTYQKEAAKFMSEITCKPEQSAIIMAAMGLTGESGEFSDIIKKTVFHGREFDKDHAVKELGDICWYLALACDCLGVTIEEVFEKNIEKLSARYSSGHFTVEEATNRAKDDV